MTTNLPATMPCFCDLAIMAGAAKVCPGMGSRGADQASNGECRALWREARPSSIHAIRPAESNSA